MQYVRLVSTPSSGTTNVVTVGKTKSQTTLQTVGVGQKIGGQQQIVKVCKNRIYNHRKILENLLIYIMFFFCKQNVGSSIKY